MRPWAGVLKTQAYAPICAQITTLGVFAGPANNNEDCLYLNVFTPNLDPSARLPVIFWIHGGGNIDGETPGYDGSKMAADGKTVVVTLEYRLNLMGWLAHPALDDEGHLFANYGILDQQLVLKWVKRNIAFFGGDKNNVTVGGQSAGADRHRHRTWYRRLLTGLFDRGICESYCPTAVPQYVYPTLASAETTGVAFSVAAGCGSGTGAATAKCLRKLTAAQVEALAGTESAASQYVVGPMIDGTVHHAEQPLTAFNNGTFNHVSVDERERGGREELWPRHHGIFLRAAARAADRGAIFELRQRDLRHRRPIRPGRRRRFWPTIRLSAFASPQLAWDRVGTDSRNMRRTESRQTAGDPDPALRL